MIQKILSLLILTSFYLYSQMYVAPEGDDNNPGTIGLPFKSIAKAVSLAGPDSLIYLRGGIHYDSTTIRLNKTGQADKPIKIWAYPGERPVIDFSGQPVSTSSRGFQISHNYWYLKGLEIRYAKDNGIYISSWYNKVENCRIYWCNDTGLQISNGGSFNIIINCDSYENVDYLTNGENADGFAPKLGVGPGNEFHGCRAWGNADDGWDAYEVNQTILIDNCWAFRNGINNWNIDTFQGDGNGFKLGGNYYAGPHIITRSVAFDNRSKGFDQNNNTAGIVVFNNTAFRNQSRNYSFPTAPSSGTHVLKNNISYLGQNLIASNSVVEANSWQNFIIGDSDFRSLDTSLALLERDSLGNLPDASLFRLAVGSQLIDAGVDVGLGYNDSAPDLGAFETPGEPVPVEMTSFTATSDQYAVILNWSTATEVQNRGWDIERRFAEKKWQKIGFVEGKGNTTEPVKYQYRDNEALSGTYQYRLKQMDYSGAFSYSEIVEIDVNNMPLEFALYQNYPNPFNPSTNFIFSLEQPGMASLLVYDITGRKVATVYNGYLNTGTYKFNWIAKNDNENSLATGIYFARLIQGEHQQIIKITFSK